MVAAFTISSDTHQMSSDIKRIFEFLSNFENFGSILPDDKVDNFQFTENECSFNIKGITPMTIRLTEKVPFQYIVFTSEGLARFNFRLRAEFSGDPDQPGQCRIDLAGDLNPFIKAMAEKPLAGLVNTMALKLAQLQLPSS